MEERKVNVTVTDKQLEKWLSQAINDKHAKLISKVIIENLGPTEIGLGQLFKAINGIEDQYKYTVGQEMMLKVEKAYAWKMDKEKMKEAGLIFQGKINVTILEIQPWLKEPYRISYEYIDNNADKQTQESNIAEEYLEPVDEYPLDQ